MTPFLGAAEDGAGRVTILGAPLDLTESFRSGAESAPNAIRELSQSLETYSPAIGRDLAEIGLVDRGNLPMVGRRMEEALEAVAAAVSSAAGRGLVITLGGEHTVTLGAVRGMRAKLPELVVIQVDAHLDLLQEYLGLQVSHATFARRMLDDLSPSSLVQLGGRSGTKDEFVLARYNRLATPALKLPARLRAELQNSPIYLSIDIDILDPAYAPGTGYPEPGGPSFSELADFLYSLDGLGVVAADVCEVLPAYDPSGITSVAAAKLVKEVALLFG